MLVYSIGDFVLVPGLNAAVWVQSVWPGYGILFN